MDKYGTQNGQIKNPTSVAVNGIGEIIVVDNGNERVQVFSSQGKYLRTIGLGVLAGPWGVAVDRNRKIAVSDRSGILIFGPDGKLLERFKGDRLWDVGPLTIGDNGNIFVPNWTENRVRVFSDRIEVKQGWN